jgi:hypothetical protein
MFHSKSQCFIVNLTKTPWYICFFLGSTDIPQISSGPVVFFARTNQTWPVSLLVGDFTISRGFHHEKRTVTINHRMVVTGTFHGNQRKTMGKQ